MSNDPAISRLGLGFTSEAERVFSYLVTEFGFRLVTANETLLRYETEAVFVNVYHGRSSYALRFELGLGSEPNTKYYPEEVAAFAGLDKETFFQASTPERVSMLLPRLGELLHEGGRRLLAGDATEFERLREVSARLRDAATRSYLMASSRERASLAWKRRDYEALVDALHELGDGATPSEELKLLYALNKLGRIQ